MSTVRRLYYYGLAFISAELIIWGITSLLRTTLSPGQAGRAGMLAAGLSLVLVGIPIFWIHWRAAQRDAVRDPEERGSRTRAIFLYAALFATFVPVIYAVMALLDRELVQAFGLPSTLTWFGSGGTTLDNGIALLVNGLATAYFWMVLSADWRANPPDHYLAEIRRLYRYVLMLFGLVLLLVGAYNMLRFLLIAPDQTVQESRRLLSGAFSMLAVGAPLWASFWWSIQYSLSEPGERQSLLRLVVLYLISLAGVVGVLSLSAGIVAGLIRWILGEPHTLLDFLQANRSPIALVIPLAVMWWYFGRILGLQVAALPDQPRRESLRRLYDYILALIGLVVLFAGLIGVVNALVLLIFGTSSVGIFPGDSRSTLAGGLSALLMGLPLWLVTWLRMEREALRPDAVGDHARRSVLRKAYLYLALFLLMIGLMGFTGELLERLLGAALAEPEPTLAADAANLFLSLVVDALLLVYHWQALRADNRAAQQSMEARYAEFPTLLMVDDNNPLARPFADAFVDALARSAPHIPVALHPTSRGAPDETMLGARAVLLTAGQAMEPPESLRLWLSEYRGQRVLVPLEQPGWVWLGQANKNLQRLASDTAQAIRQMAEGEAVRQALPANPWAIAGYILGGLFGLLLLAALLSVLISSLFR